MPATVLFKAHKVKYPLGTVPYHWCEATSHWSLYCGHNTVFNARQQKQSEFSRLRQWDFNNCEAAEFSPPFRLCEDDGHFRGEQDQAHYEAAQLLPADPRLRIFALLQHMFPHRGNCALIISGTFSNLSPPYMTSKHWKIIQVRQCWGCLDSWFTGKCGWISAAQQQPKGLTCVNFHFLMTSKQNGRGSWNTPNLTINSIDSKRGGKGAQTPKILWTSYMKAPWARLKRESAKLR